jgi:hypothetical protein
MVGVLTIVIWELMKKKPFANQEKFAVRMSRDSCPRAD